MFRSVSVPQALALVLIGVVVGAVLDAVFSLRAHHVGSTAAADSTLPGEKKRGEHFRPTKALTRTMRIPAHEVPAEVRRFRHLVTAP